MCLCYFLLTFIIFQTPIINWKMAQAMEPDGSANLQNRLYQDAEVGSMAGLDCQQSYRANNLWRAGSIPH